MSTIRLRRSLQDAIQPVHMLPTSGLGKSKRSFVKRMATWQKTCSKRSPCSRERFLKLLHTSLLGEANQHDPEAALQPAALPVQGG
eukprot:4384688-Amphidinium_carterae.1